MMRHSDRSAAKRRNLLFQQFAPDLNLEIFMPRTLFVFIRLQTRSDSSPEQMRPNLHWHVPRIVRVPDPDIAAVLDDALIRGWLHANRLEGPDRRLDLFLRLHLHGYGHGTHVVRQR